MEKSDGGSRASSFDSDYEDLADSPRHTYSSSAPMLRNSALRNSTTRRLASLVSHRAPTRMMRWLCFLLMSTVVVFILGLIRMSHISAQQVALSAETRPPPPAMWESFEFLKRYYGGVSSIVKLDTVASEYPRNSPTWELEPNVTDSDRVPMSHAYHPYPKYSSVEYTATYTQVEECFLDQENKVKVPQIHVFEGTVAGMPEPAYGSYELLGINDTICYDRYGRLGPYGFGYSIRQGGLGAGIEGERSGADNVWKQSPPVDYSKIKWSDVQARCYQKNNHRFHLDMPKAEEAPHDLFLEANLQKRQVTAPEPSSPTHSSTTLPPPPTLSAGELIPQLAPVQSPPATNTHGQTNESIHNADAKLVPTPPPKPENPSKTIHKRIPRSAFVIRTWWTYEYNAEDILFLRSLISELALHSRGEFHVHFLIHVKDDNHPIWSDPETYQKVLKESLPEEFWGMGTLWSERQMGLIYGGLAESFYRDLPVHGVYRSGHLSMQYFAHTHPEYDYFWNWEMDVRYTGHWYELLTSATKWAAKQPRKGLWERNHRFYVPEAHGPWEDFKQMVRVQSEMPPPAPKGKTYGPPGEPEQPLGPEAPIWGPTGPSDTFEKEKDTQPPTTYEKDKYTWGVGEEADLITFNPLFDPTSTGWILSEDVTGYNVEGEGFPPRRAAIITTSRMSRRLLTTMHRETALGRHTMFSEMWPSSCALHHGLKAVFVPHPVFIDRNWPSKYLASIYNAGRNGASGGGKMSVFRDELQHNFLGVSWYYHSGFAGNLWKRWLGYRVDDAGGEQEEIAGEGRMCLPGVLLHPIKGIVMPVEDGNHGDNTD